MRPASANSTTEHKLAQGSKNIPLPRRPKVESRMWEREERTLEGVVESAAAFWEEVNCEGEKSGWLEGIILSVARWP
jgi:hypothetical protein